MFVPFACPPPAESEAELVFIELHPFNRAVPPSHAKMPHSHSAAHAHPSPSPSHLNSPARHGDPPRLQQKQNTTTTITTTTIIIITHRKNLKKRHRNVPGIPRERCNSSWACLRIPAANSGSASAGTSATARSTSGNLRVKQGWVGGAPSRRREEKEWFLRYCTDQVPGVALGGACPPL
jgi:hypothetical protein